MNLKLNGLKGEYNWKVKVECRVKFQGHPNVGPPGHSARDTPYMGHTIVNRVQGLWKARNFPGVNLNGGNPIQLAIPW